MHRVATFADGLDCEQAMSSPSRRGSSVPARKSSRSSWRTAALCAWSTSVREEVCGSHVLDLFGVDADECDRSQEAQGCLRILELSGQGTASTMSTETIAASNSNTPRDPTPSQYTSPYQAPFCVHKQSFIFDRQSVITNKHVNASATFPFSLRQARAIVLLVVSHVLLFFPALSA